MGCRIIRGSARSENGGGWRSVGAVRHFVASPQGQAPVVALLRRVSVRRCRLLGQAPRRAGAPTGPWARHDTARVRAAADLEEKPEERRKKWRHAFVNADVSSVGATQLPRDRYCVIVPMNFAYPVQTLLLAACATASLSPPEGPGFPADTTNEYYTVQVLAAPIENEQALLRSFRSLRDQGHLVYCSGTRVGGRRYLRLRIGLF